MESIGNFWWWSGFALFVVVALVVDVLGLRRNGNSAVGARQALAWSALWIALALVFAAVLWVYIDQNFDRALANLKLTEFLAGYVIEKSLSVDNIFVFLTLFSYFAVPPEQQKRVLILGVIGAVVLRAIMILIGAWLLAHFHFLLYVFGAFLVVTGAKMWFFAGHTPDLEANPILRWMRRHLPLTQGHEGDALLVTRDGRRYFTPLFLVMAMIAVTDVIFAVDSVPAVFAVTGDPFIVLTSNVFAVLGLRALFFLLADMAARFHLLSYGLALILVFVGTKMLIAPWFAIPVGISLAVVGLILGATAALSALRRPKEA